MLLKHYIKPHPLLALNNKETNTITLQDVSESEVALHSRNLFFLLSSMYLKHMPMHVNLIYTGTTKTKGHCEGI